MKPAKFEDLIGKTITKISGGEWEWRPADLTNVFKIKDPSPGVRELMICTQEGPMYSMSHHDQDCCEDVHLDDICGDLSDLIGSPILKAEETSNKENDSEYGDILLWTFYHLSTKNGTVTLRWRGSSNGYYSTEVDLMELGDNDVLTHLPA